MRELVLVVTVHCPVFVLASIEAVVWETSVVFLITVLDYQGSSFMKMADAILWHLAQVDILMGLVRHGASKPEGQACN